MFAKLEEVEKRFDELERKLGDPEIVMDQSRYVPLARERSDLEEIVTVFREYKKIAAQLAEAKELIYDDDEDMRDLAENDIEELTPQKRELEERLKILLLPKDPLDDKNILLEIRAGTGGDEAALFAADLFRMYSRFAEEKRWKIEVMSANETGIGGFKEIICAISGNKVYSLLKYESGIHRVQRVPETETQGRIHTSAVTVAILPEAEDVEVQIKEEELRIDVYRSSGPGGQSVNTTDSAVRITHIPTGLVVTCQDEKSQHKNKAQAMKILKARLYEKQRQEQHDQIAAERKSQVGTGDRSGRIRTYNFPQSRLTDHRIGLTLYKLEEILNGALEPVIDALVAYYQAEAMKNTDSLVN